jgi:SAM-dependent methyltransferase
MPASASAGRPSDSSVKTPYRDQHLSVEAAAKYDELYSAGTFDDWLWQYEREYLARVIAKHLSPGGFRYLDFACGSGRVLGVLEGEAGFAVGLDLSIAMLQRAQGRVRRSLLLCADPIASTCIGRGTFDLATAFRFFLNAESDLREGALRFLHRVLTEQGLLVFNVHGNQWSPRLPAVIFRRVLLRQRNVHHLSFRQVIRMLERNGFRIVEWAGFGLLTPKTYKLFGRALGDRLQRLVQRFPRLERSCVDLVFVCRPVGASGA